MSRFSASRISFLPIKKRGAGRSPLAKVILLLAVDYLRYHRFLGSALDVVHLLYPRHLVAGFQALRHALGFRHLRHRLFDLLPRRPVDLQQMLGQPVLKQECVVRSTPMGFEKRLPHHPVFADYLRRLLVHLYIGNQVIAA